MCSSGTNAHFDSILDEKLISKAISEFKEATEALDKKLKTITISAKGVITNLAKGNDYIKCLKSDVSDKIKCIEELLKKSKVAEKSSHYLMDVHVRMSDSTCCPLLQAECEQWCLLAEAKKPHADFIIPSHATLLQEASEMQIQLRESANKGLDSAVDWIEKAKGKAEGTVKEQNEIKDDLRRQFASLQELAAQVQQVAVKVS